MFRDLITHSYRRSFQGSTALDQPSKLYRTLAKRTHSARSKQYLCLGELLCKAKQPIRLYQTLRESRGHKLILGQTGSGKTRMAAAYADQVAKAGQSIVALSPHTDLADLVLYIAKRRGLPVVNIDFGGRGKFVTPWSFLNSPNYRVDEVVHIAHSIFASSIGSGQVAGHIHTTLKALFYLVASFPEELNLYDCDRLIHEVGFAERFSKRIENRAPPGIARFFADLQGPARRSIIQKAQFALARLNSLQSFRGVRLTLNGKPSIDLRECLKSQVIIILNIPGAILGSASSLLGGLFLESLRMSVMQRGPHSREPNIFILVDELGAFVHGNSARLSSFLAESRKFGTFLIAAGQSLSQLGTQLLDAFLANAQTIISGAISWKDALYLKSFFDLEDLELPDRESTKIHALDSGPGSPQDLPKLLTKMAPRHFLVRTIIKKKRPTLLIRSLNMARAPIRPKKGFKLLRQAKARDIEARLHEWTGGSSERNSTEQGQHETPKQSQLSGRYPSSDNRKPKNRRESNQPFVSNYQVILPPKPRRS